jgi:prepilin-type N-terminal cleavage/methylation domain-containing protein
MLQNKVGAMAQMLLNPPRMRGRRPRGMTLLELLLVLFILVSVAAMSVPALQGPLDNFRLRKAASLVRARIEKARIEAMRSGRTMMFRFQLNGGTFQIDPWASNADAVEATGTLSANQMQTTAAAATVGKTPVLEELPEGVSFLGIEATASLRDASIQQALQDQQGLAQEWSPPILFYPDGTSSTVRITLTNVRQQFILLKLRGLTGVAELSDLMRAEELPK